MPTPIREKIATNVQGLLQPGEQVQAVIPAQTKSGWLGAIGALWLIMFNRYRPIIATDRRIVVTDAGKWGMSKPRSIVGEVPRSTAIGTPKGIWWKTDAVGQTLFVNKRFHKDVEQADSLRTG